MGVPDRPMSDCLGGVFARWIRYAASKPASSGISARPWLRYPPPEAPRDARATEATLAVGLGHHMSNRLRQAAAIYRQVLEARPDHPEALHLLGVVMHQMGKSADAVDLIAKAIALDPDYAEAHYNLGNMLQEQGKLDAAVAAYRHAVALAPGNAEAYSNLGIALDGLGRSEEAVAAYRQAIAVKPDYAEAHSNLGDALMSLGRIDEAIASCQAAIALKPNLAGAHNNLGIALKNQGKLEEAVAAYHRALELKPDYAEAYSNLGNALDDQGRSEEAVAVCRQAIALKPDHAESHRNLANVLMSLGRLGEAKAEFDRWLRLTHGGPWWNAATFADGDKVAVAPLAKTPSPSPFKLLDNADQLEYLIGKGRIDPSFERMVERYRAVLTEIQEMQKSAGPEAKTMPIPDQTKRLGAFYDRVVHYSDAPRIDSGAVNKSLDFESIEDSYLSSPVSLTTIDDFLTPAALVALRDFCLESTIFFSCTDNRFVSSKITTGFNCTLLYQIAEELKERLPRVLGGHPLTNMWVYRYSSQTAGVAAHTDEGAVTFNFWITPDDANQTPGRGGLVVYAKEHPYDWGWERYNSRKYTSAAGREIADFLADAETVTIPYRENRAVLFHSNLFHKSDQVRFKDGYENRRMNVTMLFGKRGDAEAKMVEARDTEIRANHAK